MTYLEAARFIINLHSEWRELCKACHRTPKDLSEAIALAVDALATMNSIEMNRESEAKETQKAYESIGGDAAAKITYKDVANTLKELDEMYERWC